MALPAVKDNKEDPLFDLGLDASEMGRPDSLRNNILNWVLHERYDRAIEELQGYLEQPSEYPNFKPRIARFINHSVDLIYAIKAKRSFPGINSLTRAKQQELREKFKEHFRELQYILKTVEKIHGDLRIEDVRSTIYVVKALWIAGVAIVALAFFLEIYGGLAKTALIVLDDIFGQFASWLVGIIGL